jgi:hypothetical protein
VQILKVDHWKLAIQIINERISHFDKYIPEPENSDEDKESLDAEEDPTEEGGMDF